MPISGELFERPADGPVVPAGLPLVILLTGFTDAGNAVSGLIDHLHETTDPKPVTELNGEPVYGERVDETDPTKRKTED